MRHVSGELIPSDPNPLKTPEGTVAEELLAIDLGTTSVKAGVLSPGGALLQSFRESYPTARGPGGWCAQDPADWTRLIDAALSRFDLEGVACAALTSQVNTHVFVDEAGAPLMPAIPWQDTRAAAEAAELNAKVSDADKIAWLGAPIPIDASHPLARMLWVSRHRPKVWERTAHVILPKDYAGHHLTGALATDPISNIGVVGPGGTYVEPMLALVPGAIERLAPIRPVTGIFGEMRGKVPVATASMDGWVGLIGAGACQEGAFAYLSGTSEILGAASHTVTNAPGIVVFNEAEGLRLHAGPTQAGGAAKAWFCEIGRLSPEAMAAMVAAAPDGPTPLFLPHLAGERAPLWNADLRGAFLGLHAGMTTADLARGVYTGVALSARHVLGALEASCGTHAEQLMCGGGGFTSDAWGTIRANVMGRPLARLAVGETGLVGAACVAAVASGLAPDLASANRPFQRFETIFEPDPRWRRRADDLFGLYQAAIDANEAIGKGLAALTAADAQDLDNGSGSP